MNFRKIIVGMVVVMCIFSTTLSPVLAAPTSTFSMAPEVRAALLVKLLDQLKVLQAELALILAAESKTKISPLPVNVSDYTRGPADARIKIVTFTDFDCPFCKLFHETLNTVVTKYSDVSISYRNFPLEQIHPNSKKLSIAAECVGTIGGDVAFWKFIDLAFDSRAVNDKTNMNKLTDFASSAGVSVKTFEACLKGTVAEANVVADMKEGLAAGVSGTPQSFIFKDDVKVSKIDGSQPLVIVEELIKNLQR